MRTSSRNIRNSRVHMIKEAGHMVMYEQPAEFDKVVTEFLKSCAPEHQRWSYAKTGAPPSSGAPVPFKLFLSANVSLGERVGRGGARVKPRKAVARRAYALSASRWRRPRTYRARPPSPRRQMRVQQVHHQVDDHARYRYVHPDRPRPARDSPMACEAAAQRADERNQGERHDHHREDDVRSQNGKVTGRIKPWPPKRTSPTW